MTKTKVSGGHIGKLMAAVSVLGLSAAMTAQAAGTQHHKHVTTQIKSEKAHNSQRRHNHSDVMINPQPEPPGAVRQHRHNHSDVMINPQPEPPGAVRQHRHDHSDVMINPQPEPPGAVRQHRHEGPSTQLNPQPEPPAPGQTTQVDTPH